MKQEILERKIQELNEYGVAKKLQDNGFKIINANSTTWEYYDNKFAEHEMYENCITTIEVEKDGIIAFANFFTGATYREENVKKIFTTKTATIIDGKQIDDDFDDYNNDESGCEVMTLLVSILDEVYCNLDTYNIQAMSRELEFIGKETINITIDYLNPDLEKLEKAIRKLKGIRERITE